MVEIIHKYPKVAKNEETTYFWEQAKEGKFMVRRCPECGEIHWYPRTLCPLCHKAETKWEEHSGDGEIYTWTVMRKSPTGPFALGYVKLDGGPYVYVRFRDGVTDGLEIGKRAKIVFDKISDDDVYMFADLA
ncbi:hypothetical protein ATO6_22160 [Oceanicola sp. 22II-s10i]|uniref:Zn-ribbon domain-containing OB-fold protein n=1 Tax=Oceanicola sp. 22II-s10i TaxID=1317116 RepID=UPI000B527CF7|nr:OB-fold domain-containing protein [Oceanicola sp. 22II-s10i]OWU82332.1 hypothetical protein ATO6_22160 [Oceanicola sp. 22II-s10i]